MHFDRPLIFILLIFPVMLAIWEWRRHGFRIRIPADHSRIPERPLLGRMVNMAGLLPAMIAALGIILLAGPQKEITGRVVQERRNIHFLLDVSGSMSLPYGASNRYSEAMKAIVRFTSYRTKDDAFALSVFGGEVIHWIPLTQEVSAIELAEPFLRPGKLSSSMGGTRVGHALRKLLPIMMNQDGDRMIILLTDGQSGDLRNDQAYKIGQSLRDANITVYSVYTGGRQVPAELSVISQMTHGDFFTPEDPLSLEKTFRHIAQMKKNRAEPLMHTYINNDKPAVFAGLCLLAMNLLAGFGLRYTPW